MLLNYPCPRAWLESPVPAGTELDDWHGQTLVSLVGFLFADTRLKGVPIPFHRTEAWSSADPAVAGVTRAPLQRCEPAGRGLCSRQPGRYSAIRTSMSAAIMTPDVPKPPPSAAASVTRKPFYFIPGCYLGDVPPEKAGLPATCDPGKVVVYRS